MKSKLIIFILLLLVSCKRNESVSDVTLIYIGLVVLIGALLLGVSLIVARNRIQRIKRIYNSTKSQLHFWDKLDRNKLEAELKNNKLPAHWIFYLNHKQNKIEDIFFYEGLSVSRIAQDKEKLFTSLRKRINKN